MRHHREREKHHASVQQLRGPHGSQGFGQARCQDMGVRGVRGTHDRDVNAAKNILSGARCSPSVSGNESSPSAAPPSHAPRLREARISAVKAAA
jgi:hypothetical protein